MSHDEARRQRYGIEPLLNLRDVAEIFGISTRSVERLIERGDLDPVWVGGVRRFQPGDIRDLPRRGGRAPRGGD
jgi:hypothetical protein